MWSSAIMADCSGVRRGSMRVVFLEGDAEFLDVEAIGESGFGNRQKYESKRVRRVMKDDDDGVGLL